MKLELSCDFKLNVSASSSCFSEYFSGSEFLLGFDIFENFIFVSKS